MNIALIGAPGSGKSDLAQLLKPKLKGSTTTVDNYVLQIQEETNLAIGQITDYVGNLCVALGRYGRERHARGRGDNTITCGTLIETAVYFAMHIVSLNEVLPEEQKLDYAPRADAMMRVLSCLYQDIFTYDHLFYLPAVDLKEDSAFIDKQIQAGLGGFKLAETTTLPVVKGDRLEAALRTIG